MSELELTQVKLPSIDHYTGVEDWLDFSCRLLRKVYKAQQKIIVQATDEMLQELDTKLWSFSQLEFIPHCYIADPIAQYSSIWLTEAAPANIGGIHCLLNLSETIVNDNWKTYPRVLEMVRTDEASLKQARQRYRYYQQAGCTEQNRHSLVSECTDSKKQKSTQ